MIDARIGYDHFLVWRLPLATAERLLPGLTPVTEAGAAFLLFAAAEFRVWRWHGLPGLGPLHVAGWLIPCHFVHRGSHSIGNAFLHRYLAHSLLAWSGPRIRLDRTRLQVSGVASGQRRG